MPKLIVKNPNGSRQELDVSSRVELDAQSIGKKWPISLDDGRTFQPLRAVGDAAWRSFFAMAGGATMEPSPSGAPATETARPPVRPEPPRREEAVDRVSPRVEVLEGSMRELVRQVDDLLARDPAPRGEFDRARQQVDATLTQIDQRLGALSGEELDARVERAAETVSQRIDGMLKRLRQQYTKLEDLADEQIESVGRYRPGVVETLEQRLTAERAEIEVLRARKRELEERLDEREREIRRLGAGDGVVDSNVVDDLRERLATLRGEIEQRKGVEAERDGLRLRVAELEVDLERRKADQAARETDLEIRREVEALRGTKQTLEDELDQATAAFELNKQRRTELKDSLRAREAELTKERQKALEALRDCAERDAQLASLTAERDSLRSERDGAVRRAAEAETRTSVLSQALQEEARRAQTTRDALLQQRSESIRVELERASEDARRALQTRAEQAQRELESARQRAEQESKRASQLEAELRDARAEQSRWRAEEAARDERLARFSIQVEQSQQAAAVAETRLRELRAEEQRRLDEEEARRSVVRGELGALDSQLAIRRAALDELKSAEVRKREDAKVEFAGRIAILEAPWFKDPRAASTAFPTESTWLEGIRDRMEAADFHFPRRLLESFHTSLKIAAWAPLTVLAGVSGTGKSELPRLYSLYGGLRFLPVPVQPNWDSPQDLFGFFDYVGGRFRATSLVRAMVQSQRAVSDGGFDDALLLVLLDEMNLARVELYFSELLSRLETRRGLDREAARRECAVRVDLGAGVEEYPVPLGENVVWVGTMNEDETTQTLSDKVLDRGNVLSFPRPKALRSRADGGLGEGAAWLPRAAWERWQRRPDETLPANVRGSIREALEQINEALSSENRAVGHRVMQAVERYVANHPRVQRPDGATLESDAWRVPFEDQVVQKVMPKLRGIDVGSRSGRRCLDGVLSVLQSHAPGLVDDFGQAREDARGAFVWTRASYLEDGHEQTR